MLPETIKSALRAYWKNNYATYLVQAEANHSDDPIILEDFKDHIFSNTRVFQTHRQYPYSEFCATLSRAESEAQQSALAGQWGTMIEVRYKFRGDTDLEKLAKTIDRHHEATLLMLDADEHLGGALPRGFTDLEFRLIETDQPFFQGLMVRFRVRHKVV